MYLAAAREEETQSGLLGDLGLLVRLRLLPSPSTNIPLVLQSTHLAQSGNTHPTPSSSSPRETSVERKTTSSGMMTGWPGHGSLPCSQWFSSWKLLLHCQCFSSARTEASRDETAMVTNITLHCTAAARWLGVLSGSGYSGRVGGLPDSRELSNI